MNTVGSSSSSSKNRSGNNGKSLCRYFASNICNRGDSCPFSHDRNSKPDMTCSYYLAGNCTYGQGCRYDHIRPKSSAQSATNGGVMASSSNSQAPNSSAPRSGKIQGLSPAAAPEAGFSSIKKTNIVVTTGANSSSTPPMTTSNAWTKPLPGLSVDAKPFTMSSMLADLERADIAEMSADFASRMRMPADIPLCPYFVAGYCLNGDACTFVHGTQCEMCQLNALHPFSDAQRKEHHRACLAEHEAAMEAAFAEARSIDKQCGICMEQIVEKNLRFGILENCKHCFCLACIRKWRQRSAEFTSKIIRSCPECRIVSDYVIPSATWVEDAEEKKKVIAIYHQNMKQKECKYIKSGSVDDCPFGNKCFYRHQKPDGTPVQGESPRELQKRRRFLVDMHREFLDDTDEDEQSIMDEVIQAIVMSVGGGSSSSGSSGGGIRRAQPRQH